MIKINPERVHLWLQNLESGVRKQYGDSLRSAHMIGIRTGGVTVAKALHERLDLPGPMGELNISFYRDDFSSIGLHPVVGASEIPFDIEGSQIILVDDVLSTGRTIRAALNEIFDFGRPARVILAVLVEREGHELPIRADVAGHTMELPVGQQIKLDPVTMECHINEPDRATKP